MASTLVADLWAGGSIGFREALEATMIVVILILLLRNGKREDLVSSIWKGVGLGVGASIVTAIIFEMVIGNFEDNEAWFEGILMIISSILIAIVVFHLIKHYSKKDLEDFAEKAMLDSTNGAKSLSIIAFLSVWREGSETVIFLGAGTESMWAIAGLAIGIAIAIVLGWLMLDKGVHIDIKKLFTASTVLLIFVGAGLLAHGVHELQEEDAGMIPVYNEEIWDLNPEWDGEGTAPVLHDKGTIGGLFRALIGWNGDPTLLEFCSWVGYLGAMFAIMKKGSHHTGSTKSDS
jgi:high-affinity iron transporter